MMEMRSHLGRARGLGSAKHGVGHWFAQRVTAIALVPLSVWFVFAAVSLVGADYAEFRDWMAMHGNLVLLIAFLIALFHHVHLGLQVVIEDYVHHEMLKTGGIILVRFVAFLCAASTILSALRVAFFG